MFDATEQAVLFNFFCVMSFIIGACLGSFYNVCIYRIPMKQSIVKPASHCFSCGTYLKWYDNIPILGWPMLGGRCRYCGTPYSSRYCLVELLTAVLYLIAFIVFGPTVLLLFIWLFLGLLIIGTFTDIDHFIIPNRINYGGLLIGLLGGALVGRDWPACRAMYNLMDDVHFLMGKFGDVEPWWVLPPWADGLLCAGIGAGFGWLLLWLVSVGGRLLFRKEAMGFGDVKLMAFLGAFLGVQGCLEVVGLASFLGAFVSVTMIALHRMIGRDKIVEAVLDPEKLPELCRTEANTSGGVVHVRIPLRTAGQLHYLPFGPYLAVAAIIIVLCYKQVEQLISWWLSIG